jgi:hypothetical protein
MIKRIIDKFSNASSYQEAIDKLKTRVAFLSNRQKDLIAELYQFYSNELLNDLSAIDSKKQVLLNQLLGTSIGEAFYILNAINQTKQIEGDICEFGVAQGSTSALMANEISNTNRKIWLFDSFEGLPKPSQEDELIHDIFNLGSIEAYHGQMSNKRELVEAKLNAIDFPENRIEIVPGFIEETIVGKHLPKKVSFAYVDFDFYEPIKIALEYLDKCMDSGAIIVVDDYQFFSSGVEKAVQEFLESSESNYEFTLPVQTAGKFCLLRKL